MDDASATFTCTVYSGTGVATTGPFTASGTFVQGDLTLALADGIAGTQSFNVGDQWIVGVPGTPLLQAGADKQTLSSLAQECRNRWTMLSDVPTMGRFEGWVFACAKTLGLGITKVTTSPSADVAGIENVVIAGDTATATPDQVAAVQAYINARLSQIEGAQVSAASAYPIPLGGVVKCRRGTTAAVKTAADAGWVAYLASLPIGGAPPQGTVFLARFEQVLMDAGAYNVSGLTIDSSAADVNLAPYECATVAAGGAGMPSTALTWQEVS